MMLLLLLQRKENRHSCGSWRSTRSPENTVDNCLKRASALPKGERFSGTQVVAGHIPHEPAPFLVHALERRLRVEVVKQQCARALLCRAFCHRRTAIHEGKLYGAIRAPEHNQAAIDNSAPAAAGQRGPAKALTARQGDGQ
jgi:hypothetical protein